VSYYWYILNIANQFLFVCYDYKIDLIYLVYSKIINVYNMELSNIDLNTPSYYYDFPSYTIIGSTYYIITNDIDNQETNNKVIYYYSVNDKLLAIVISYNMERELLENECIRCLENKNGFNPSIINIKGNKHNGYNIEYYNTSGMKITSHILHLSDDKKMNETKIKKLSLKNLIEYNCQNRNRILNDNNKTIQNVLIKILEKQVPNYEWIIDNSDKICYIKSIFSSKSKSKN